MMVNTNPTIEMVKAALADAVARATEEAIAEAQKDFERRVRRAIGLAGLEVSRFFEFDRHADRVIITIKTRDAG